MKKPANSKPELIRICGESKSAEAWARDPRCEVSASRARARLQTGMAPEEALQNSKAHITVVAANGEAKTAWDWARDPRCEVPETTLRNRIKRGIDPLVALRRECPDEMDHRLLAFGERKSLKGWSEDARCVVAYWALQDRLKSGVSLEEAMVTPSNLRKYAAFGELKPLGDWASDTRCCVSRKTLYSRISRGVPLEQALLGENDSTLAAKLRVPRYTAFGETKTLSEWADDDRCRIGRAGLRGRLARGMSVEEAIVTPALVPKPPHRDAVYCEVFGERKRISEWGRDPRCVVETDCFRERVRRGMQPEKALTEPNIVTPERTRAPNELVEAFGEFKTLKAWSEDPRCKANYEVLVSRTHRGMAIEAALTVGLGEPRLVRMSAFGETKTFKEWSRDPRCEVGLAGLRKRVQRGLPMEIALSKPKTGERFLSIQAFGETKSLREWYTDERCQVCLSTLRFRLDRGESLEDAFRPPDNLRFKRFWDLEQRGFAASPPVARKASRSLRDTQRVEIAAAVPLAGPRKVKKRRAKKRTRQSIPAPEPPVVRSQTPAIDRTEVLFSHQDECKSILEWAGDPRCVLSADELEICLISGRTISEVIVYGRLALKPWVGRLR